MPCNMLAVRAGQMLPDVAKEILANPAAIEATRQIIAGLLNQEPATVTVWNEQHHWWEGWQQYLATKAPQQTVPLDKLAGSRYLDFATGPLAVRLTAGGGIEYRDGWELGRGKIGQAALQAFKPQLEQLLGQLAMGLQMEKAVAALGQAGEIVADQWDEYGARTIIVEIEV